MAQGISEQVLAFAAVESKCHFIEVSGQMLCGHLMPCPDDAALQERERGLDGVGVHDAAHVLPPLVPDRLVLLAEVPAEQFVHRQFVRDEQFDLVLVGELLEVLAERFGSQVLGVEEPEFAAALPNRPNDLLVVPPVLAAARLAAHVGLVHLDDAADPAALPHGVADSVAEIPRGLVTDAEQSLHLIGRDALAGLNHQQHGGEPRLQRQVTVAEDRACRDGELVAALALELVAVGNGAGDIRFAPGTLDAFRPTQTLEQFPALLVGGVGAHHG